MKDEWDWKKLISTSEYLLVSLNNWAGWDREKGEPISICCIHISGSGKQSRDIAIEFDDIAEGKFYYRDYTESSIPIVKDGETYESIFVFQDQSDVIKFINLFTLNLRFL